MPANTYSRCSPCASQAATICLALAAVFIVACPAVAKSTDPAIAHQIDALLSAAYPADGPGAAVLVTRGGDVILREGYGLADLELGVPMAPDMVLRIGSVTKQFTAVAILTLVEEGKLALDDPIARILPDYPAHGAAITVEHLLTHTSGIRSYTDQEEFLPRLRDDYTVEGMIARFADEPLDFAPGTRWQYNNSGYFLLGEIIEKLTGQTWATYLQERIFTPLGMTATYADRHERVIPRRIPGYEPDPDGGWRQAGYLSMTQPYAAGAMLSTVDDLARWYEAVAAGEVVAPASLTRAWTPYRLADGSSTGYGYGWVVGEWQGSPLLGHGGGINGFLSETYYAPEERVFVAVLTNSSGASPGPTNLAQRIAGIALGKPWEPREVAVAADVLRRYVGVYRIDERTTRTVSFEDGKLYTQRSGSAKLEAVPMAEREFFYRDTLSRFVIDLDEAGRVVGMTMHRPAGEPERAVLTDEQPPVRTEIVLDPAVLDRYVGRYELAPGFVLAVTREGDRLWTQATGQEAVAIYPESATRFFLKVVDAQLEFDLPGTGPAAGVTLFQAGRAMPARRLPD